MVEETRVKTTSRTRHGLAHNIAKRKWPRKGKIRIEKNKENLREQRLPEQKNWKRKILKSRSG